MDNLKNGHGSPPTNVPLKCSLCGKMFDRSESKCLPFCSRRCQQIDLSRWLGEDYGLPIERSDDGFSDLANDDENE